MGDATLVFHIAVGLLSLASGYAALFASKGSRLHRRSGMVFVAAMLPMSITGLTIALTEPAAPAINVPAAAITFYMVVTGLVTVRPPAFWSRAADRAAMWAAWLIAAACAASALASIAAGGRQAGAAFPLVVFGAVAVAAAIGDRRVIRDGGPTGTRRLARHFWRMCFALLIAASAFFLGQADEFPPALRVGPVLALPVLTVLAAMAYWRRRLRTRGPMPTPAASAR